MTAVQSAQIVAAVGVALALVGLVAVVVLAGRLRRLQRQQRVILGSIGERDLLQHVVSLDEKVANLRTAVEDLGLSSRDHEARIDACVSRVGVVRFDAYDDLGGRQSTAIALMDAKEDGVVVTTVISRDFARMYVKLLRDGRPDIPLAPEEIEAVDEARTRAPFTIRPRMDEGKGTEQEEAALAEEESTPEDDLQTVRELERENRRRQRHGLPPLDELPPLPSTQGWQALDIPAGPPQSEDETDEEGPDSGSDSGDPSENRSTETEPGLPAAAPNTAADRVREASADGHVPEPAEVDGARRPPAADVWFDDDSDPDWPDREQPEDRA